MSSRWKWPLFVLPLFVCVLAVQAQGQTIRYVNPSLTTGANNGSSWVDAFHDLNPATTNYVSGLQIA